MGARDKLNGVVVGACLFVSALLGAAMESWWAFWGIFLILVTACNGAGGIRTHPDARPPGDGRGGRRHPTRGR